MKEVSIEDVVSVLRQATHQNGLGVWDHKIVRTLGNQAAVDAIKANLFEIEKVYARDTASAMQIIKAAREKREGAMRSLVDACMSKEEHAEMLAKPRCVVLAPTN